MNKKLKLFFSVVLCSIPVIIYFNFLFHYAINVPYSDDFYAILNFLNQYTSATNLQQKLSLLFAQHNEHRIVLAGLITLGQLYVCGKINFTALAFCGNIGLLIVMGVFYGEFKKLNLPLLYFTPLPFLLLNLGPYENVVWALSAMQANFVITFALLSFYYATYYLNRKGLFFASLNCFASAFTSGNGILSPLINSITKLFTRRYKSCIYFFILFLIVTACYFYHWQQPGGTRIHLESIHAFNELLIFFLVFIGSLAQNISEVPQRIEYLSIAISLCVFLIFSWILLRKKISAHEFLF